MIDSLLTRMKQSRMDKLVNFIIMSDHGMTYGANPGVAQHPFANFPFEKYSVRQVSMEAALRPVGRQVRYVIGEGAYAMVYPRSPKMIDNVLEALHMSLKGVDIYTADEIPDHLHWKQSKYCPPILVLARPGTVIMRASGQHQRPVVSNGITSSNNADEYEGSSLYLEPGISGYDPEEPDMRGVFMARGPGFVDSNEPQPPIHLVDVYRMLCFLLDIQPLPNDGIWDRIRNLLKNSSVSVKSSVVLTTLLTLLTTLYNNYHQQN